MVRIMPPVKNADKYPSDIIIGSISLMEGIRGEAIDWSLARVKLSDTDGMACTPGVESDHK